MLADQVYQRTQEQGFLPAALEVRDTPPSPMGRAILWTILLFFILTIAWASYGKVDIVAVAPGRIIPSGHSKVIQPLETGTVHRLYVTEGQPVHKGDILVELDPTTSVADLRRLQQEAQELRQQCQRLERILALNQHERSDADYSRIEYDQLTPLQERLFPGFPKLQAGQVVRSLVAASARGWPVSWCTPALSSSALR